MAYADDTQGVPDELPSPFGFVPLAENVVEPDWAHQTSQDVPFSDGHCGWIDLTFTAETPICVRAGGQSPREVALPFQVGERYALPGSSIRGLLRNTMEIAAFGKMKMVDDRRFGVRDLTRAGESVYREHMAGIQLNPRSGKREPMPLVQAGWLRRSQEVDSDTGDDVVVATITPCHWGKIHYEHLVRVAEGTKTVGFHPGDRQSAPRKYRAWLKGHDRAPLRRFGFFTETLRPAGVHGPTEFCKVTGGGSRKGTVVLTGQPNLWKPTDFKPKGKGAGNPKQHDFVFFENVVQDGSADLRVTLRDLKDFEFIHSDSGQQDSLGRSNDPNAEWRFWKPRFDAGERVPVFFLLQTDCQSRPVPGRLRAFGLAMMFRLAYSQTTHDVVRKVQKAAFDPLAHLDMAELVFGTVPETGRSPDEFSDDESRRQAVTLRGRVQVGTAFADPGTTRLADNPVEAVLSSPRASYYPSYLEQQPGSPLHTYMDDGARARGWKRYRPQKPWTPPRPTDGSGHALSLDKTGTRFRPLAAGARFRCRVRVHNLRTVELGALLWSATYGGDPTARHVLGLARPLGYGRVRVRVAGAQLRRNDAWDQFCSPDVLERSMQEFASYMDTYIDKWLGVCWSDTRQIRALLELARPLPDGAEQGHYPQLKRAAYVGGRRRSVNDFQHFKNLGRGLPDVQGPEAALPRLEMDPAPPARVKWGTVRRASAVAGASGSTKPPPAAMAEELPDPKQLRKGQVVSVRLTGFGRDGTTWEGTLAGTRVRCVIKGPKPDGLAEGQTREVKVAQVQETYVRCRW